MVDSFFVHRVEQVSEFIFLQDGDLTVHDKFFVDINDVHGSLIMGNQPLFSNFSFFPVDVGESLVSRKEKSFGLRKHLTIYHS